MIAPIVVVAWGVIIVAALSLAAYERLRREWNRPG